MQRLTDDILMRHIKAGDTQYLGTLYERYKDKLFNYFLRTTQDYEASCDLIMDTFERVHKYRHTFREDNTFRSWLYRIAHNLAMDYFKKSKRAIALLDSPSSLESIVAEVSTDDENIKQLHIAMRELSPRERSVIQMYYLLEMPYSEIAQIENITVNNARIIVCRGLKMLNKILKQTGI